MKGDLGKGQVWLSLKVMGTKSRGGDMGRRGILFSRPRQGGTYTSFTFSLALRQEDPGATLG